MPTGKNRWVAKYAQGFDHELGKPCHYCPDSGDKRIFTEEEAKHYSEEYGQEYYECPSPFLPKHFHLRSKK